MDVLSGATGQGDGHVVVHAAPHAGSVVRSAVLEVAGHGVTIDQAPPVACDPTLAPIAASFGDGGQHTVHVYSSPVNQNTMRECPWEVTAEVPWLRATPSRGWGFNLISVVVDPNPSPSARQGTILVERVRLSVWQAGR